ncbi:MAG: inorganic diphosphatase [Candidatus Saccharimonas sp.]|nr:inorganic diphosphatase [Candidatus Saccharimonas sp.]
MPDFNVVLTPGDVDAGTINTVVEIPEGSRLKVEWDRTHAAFMLDRVEPRIFAKPCNYGFIPQTLDEDGDELDTLIICPEPLATGVWLEAKILGVMKFEDDGEVDDKIVCVPADNRDDADVITSLDDIPQVVKQLEHHFTHYKDLKKPGSTKVVGWGDPEEAKQIIKKCIDRFSNK